MSGLLVRVFVLFWFLCLPVVYWCMCSACVVVCGVLALCACCVLLCGVSGVLFCVSCVALCVWCSGV